MSTAKTEEPTARRLRELRRDGEVPLSRELNKSAALVGALLALAATLPTTVAGLIELSLYATIPDADPVAGLLLAGALLVRGAMPVAGGAALAGFAMGAVQTGLVFAPGRVLPKAQRFAPGQTWKSRFRADALVNVTIAGIATFFGALAAAGGIAKLVGSAESIGALARGGGAAAVASVVVDAMAVVGASWLGIAALVAIVDATWQRQAFSKRHRMSLQEIRDEMKRSEGDPQHKARRARAHRELLAGNWREGVGRADVVVTNPVRIAVGLRYRADELDAPVVTVTGRGEQAKAIKREARRRGVPEYMDRVAARAIVDIDVGEPVPEKLFEPVAVIFRWLSTLE